MKKQKSTKKKLFIKKKTKKKNTLNPSKYLIFKNTENLLVSPDAKRISNKNKNLKKKTIKKNSKRKTVLHARTNNFLKKDGINKYQKKIISGLDLVYIIKNDKNLKNLLKKEIFNKEIKDLDNEIQLIKNNTKINFEIFSKENEILKLENLENKKKNEEIELRNLTLKKENEKFLLENNSLKLENNDLKNENNFVIFKNEKFKTENFNLEENLKKEKDNFLEFKFIVPNLVKLINEKIFVKETNSGIKENLEIEIKNILEKLKNLIKSEKKNEVEEEKENIWKSMELKELSLSKISKNTKNTNFSKISQNFQKEELKKNKENFYSEKIKNSNFDKKPNLMLNFDSKNFSNLTKNSKDIFQSEIKKDDESGSYFENLKYSDISYVDSEKNKIQKLNKKKMQKISKKSQIIKIKNKNSPKTSKISENDSKSEISENKKKLILSKNSKLSLNLTTSEITEKNEISNLSDNSKNSFNIKSEEIMAKIQKLTNCLNCSDDSSQNYSNTFSKFKSNFSEIEISKIEKNPEKTKLEIICSKEMQKLFANLEKSDLQKSKRILNELKSKVFSENNNESFADNFEFFQSQLGNIEGILKSSLLRDFDEYYTSKIELPNFYKND